MNRLALPLLFLGALTFSCAADADPPVEAEAQGVGADRRVDPIEVGRAWTYDVQVLGWYPLCRDGVFTARTLGSVSVGGREGKVVESLCARAGTFAYSVDGDRVWSWYAGAWRLSVDAPV